ncbi:uncharacterized protein LOC143345562 isoform X11 [Colletes latitarsis]|uniref:uncharacterized protein LOC143345562 isoform X11 n=1 Tax=Colletes latitarsis TaxID=2605962 RepID=UPI0040352A24
MSSLDYLDLCRLCLVKDRVSVPIFDGEGDVRQIFLKIAACLPVKVAREDKLPKKICDDCVYKVELFYQFWNTTVNAEKQLLQWLGEVGMEGKQGYVTNVLNPNVMKQEQSTENRLDGSVMQQVSEHQNNMGIGMMDNIGLGIPMIISNTNQQQQITSVPMDTSSNSAQNVQAVPGPSSQTTHNQISQNQTSSTQQEEEEESSEDEENSDDECDGDEGLPVKEESEEDPNSRTIEPTTFVNVSLACDEAGPSGLQQQKIADMPEIPMPQTADGDPKSGVSTIAETSTSLNPAEQHVNVCNGPVLGLNETPFHIKPPPDSEEEEDSDSLECDFESIYDHAHLQEPKVENESPANNSCQEETNRPLANNVNKVSSGTNTDPSLLEAPMPKEQSCKNPEKKSVEPPKKPLIAPCRNLFVPVEVKDEPVANLTINDLLPRQDGDGSASSKDNFKPLLAKKIKPILLKPIIGLNGKIIRFEVSNLHPDGPEDDDVSTKRTRKKPSTPITEEQQVADKVEMEEDNLPKICPYCENVYSTEDALDTHFRNYHQNHYRCKKCRYIYESQELLEEHEEVHEQATGPLQCNICENTYKRPWGLRQHQIRVHSIIEPKIVSVEGAMVHECRPRKENLQQKKISPCDSCDHTYAQQSHLMTQERVNHGERQEKRTKEFRCNICKSYFVSEDSLQRHVKLHDRIYTCDECGKSFREKYVLKQHIRKHTGERPFQCKVCYRRFAELSVLRVHKLTHTGERPYVCNVCGRTFTQRSSMMIHYRKHPGNHPLPPVVSLANRDSDE